MTVTFNIGSLNLNDNVAYYLLDFDPGTPSVDEVWIEPPIDGAMPVLVRQIARKTRASVRLAVRGTTAVDLQSKVDDVRKEFIKANTVAFKFATGNTVVSYTTFPTNVPPAFHEGKDLYLASNYFWVTDWTIEFWRAPDKNFIAL